jgi:hypothetical protein
MQTGNRIIYWGPGAVEAVPGGGGCKKSSILLGLFFALEGGR